MDNSLHIFVIAAVMHAGGLMLFFEHWRLWILSNVGIVGTCFYVSSQNNSAIRIFEDLDLAHLALFGSICVLGLTYFLVQQISDGTNVIRGTKLKSKSEINKISTIKSRDFISLSGAKIPLTKNEGMMFCVAGETGSGKTQAILSIMKQLIEKGDRLVVFDPSGDLMKYLYSNNDIILSTEDERSVNWSPFAEIRMPSDCLTISEGLISNQTGEAASWYENAQQYTSDLMATCLKNGQTSNADLIELLSKTPNATLRELLADTPSSRFTDSGADRQLASIQGIASSNLRCLRELNPMTNDSGFSLKAYCGGHSSCQNLWLPYSDISASLTSPLRRCWARIIIRTLMSAKDPSQGRNKRTWLIVDEIASNSALDDLNLAASRGRKYGLGVIAGMQSASQLNEIFGADGARSLLSNFSNSLILRSPESETAKLLAATIGQQEISRTVHRGESRYEQTRELRDVSLPAEIMSLPDRTGYLKVGAAGWTKIVVPIIAKNLKVRTRFQYRTTTSLPNKNDGSLNREPDPTNSINLDEI